MLIEITYNVTDVYMSTTETPVYVEISFEQPGGSAAVWGSITGTLSNQTDLQNALNLKVPYTGATTNVNLGEYELKAGQVTLDTSPTGTAAVGTIRWNDTTGTSETTLKGGDVIIKNGVDLVARVVNKVSPNTTLTKAAYQAVRVSGAQGQRLAVALAQANNDANSADTIGLVTETIAPNQEGFIMTMGQLENINTTGSLQGETWIDGDVLYLSPTTAGAITNVQPTGSGHIVVIGYVEYAHANNGKIFVKVLNGWELTELHDTEIISPANNEALIYESSTSLWKNKSITTALGFTPVPTTRNITINGVTYDLSADRTWTISTGISGSGASGQVTYWTGASAVSGSNNLFWSNSNGRLGINTNNPTLALDVLGNVRNYGSGLVNYTIETSLASGFSYLILKNTATSGKEYHFSLGGPTVGTLANSFYIYDNTAAATRLMVSTTGNLLLNKTNDEGQRLQVSGDTLLRGSGSTNTTTALTVQNSSSTNLLRVINNGDVSFGADSMFWDNPQRRLGVGTNTPSNTLTVAGNIEIRNSGVVGSAQVNTLKIGTYIDGDYGSSISTSTNYGSTLNTDLRFDTSGAERLRIQPNGNLSIGTISDLGVRLGVVGDTLLRGSGATSATTALTVQNSDSTNLLRIRNDSTAIFGGGAQFSSFISNSTASSPLQIRANVASLTSLIVNFTSSITAGSGSYNVLEINQNFSPTSGTATFNSLLLNNTINQTGGANGTTRGLYVNPTLTAAADWRSIQWDNNSGWGLYGAGTANNYLAGNLGIAVTPNAWTVVKALQIQRSSFTSYSDSGFASSQFTTNAYYDGSWRYVGTGGAAKYDQQTNNIAHFWSIAPSGTLGNAITFTQAMTLFNTGNLSIGTASDLAVRLGVVGDTLLRGSGNTSATTALTVQNSSSTNLFTVRNDGLVSVTGASLFGSNLGGGSQRVANFRNSGGNGYIEVQGSGAFAAQLTSDDSGQFYIATNATAGTAKAANFVFNSSGYLGIGTTPTALTDVGASTTTRASIRIRSGIAPTTPNDGDIWFDGTDIKMRIGGVTKTFTLI